MQEDLSLMSGLTLASLAHGQTAGLLPNTESTPYKGIYEVLSYGYVIEVLPTE